MTDLLDQLENDWDGFMESLQEVRDMAHTDGKCRGCGCPVEDGFERCGKAECSPFYV